MLEEKLKQKGLSFQALFTAKGLNDLDQHFLSHLKIHAPELQGALHSYRTQQTVAHESEFLIALAVQIELFLSDLFDLVSAIETQKGQLHALNPLFVFKQFYVQREAKRKLKKIHEIDDFNNLDHWVTETLLSYKLNEEDRELAVAKLGQLLLEDAHPVERARLIDWCTAALGTTAGQQAVAGWVTFQLPQKRDHDHLVPLERVPGDDYSRQQHVRSEWRQRDGFALTDQRMSSRQIYNEIHYCVYCHKNQGDFCSKGFPVKKSQPELGLKTNSLDEVLTGCPLEERISEMHVLKRDGYGLAALAMIMRDNPMCAATGHRICNDCMKACIYQKQDPVDIPQIETAVLTDVLDLPWGVELYDLLTRWNPLRSRQWLPQTFNGKRVLVMGMGPAGFTLAHHLLMEGCAVVGADGLKIEALPEHYLNQPIAHYADLVENLEDRVVNGFGGVAEYGITVRWDKNFLKLIYITLARRPFFQVVGGVRFGGTLTIEHVWALGFDHLSLAVGAGLPKELAIPNSLAPGMRQANDFLMALQLTGAAKASSLANLQVRLPAVVIGGGLTGVDTATEVQAYYIKQVEKVATRYHALCHVNSEASVRQRFDENSLAVLDEFLAHAVLVKEERDAARVENRQPNFVKLIHDWGGVTIVYRRSMKESPAYRRNHEELDKALEEGVFYLEGLEPAAVDLDASGHCAVLQCRVRHCDAEGNWSTSAELMGIPAKGILVATGAKLNVAYGFEHQGSLLRERFEYPRFELDQNSLTRQHELGHVKMDKFGPFTSYDDGQHTVSFLGDTHPVFHGSVVKAIASAMRVYPYVMQALERCETAGKSVLPELEQHIQQYDAFRARIQRDFTAEVVRVERHTADLVELTVRAPMAAAGFRPGEFYRVQNFERDARWAGETQLQSEGMALIGIPHKDSDCLSFIVLEQGASSRLVSTFKPAQPLLVMGPTGVRAKLPEPGQVIMITGNRLAAAYVLSVGPALKAQGVRIIFVPRFKSVDRVFARERLEACCEAIWWSFDEGPEHFKVDRAQDRLLGMPFEAALEAQLRDYLEGVRLSAVSIYDKPCRVESLRAMFKDQGKALLDASPRVTASVYGPMQCMLKGVCAQCLQWQVDEKTGERTKAVYACSWQEQPVEKIDLDHLEMRLHQNETQEILSRLWLDHLIEAHEIESV